MSAPTPPPDYDMIKVLVDLGQFLLTGVIAFYLWIVNNSKATNGRIGQLQDDVDARFDKQGERITRVETHLEHLPSRESIGKVHARLDDLNKEMGEVHGELSGIKRQTHMISEYLMKKEG